eukprot:1016768-Amorphochlora_amoeboformis.AAC.1
MERSLRPTHTGTGQMERHLGRTNTDTCPFEHRRQTHRHVLAETQTRVRWRGTCTQTHRHVSDGEAPCTQNRHTGTCQMERWRDDGSRCIWKEASNLSSDTCLSCG